LIKYFSNPGGNLVSSENDKIKNSRRRQKDQDAVIKQVKIAKAHGLTDKDLAVKEPHRMAKHHAMDCGRPGCMLCGNPRKIFKELTTQEKRMYQDVDQTNDKHSNGIPPKQQD
jgi:hypothetical protein